MQVRITSDAPASYATGALVIPVFTDKLLDGVAKEIDAALGGALTDVLESGEIAGKSNELAVVHAKDAPYRRVALVGLGDRGKFSPHLLARLAGTAVRTLGNACGSSTSISTPVNSFPFQNPACGVHAVGSKCTPGILRALSAAA